MVHNCRLFTIIKITLPFIEPYLQKFSLTLKTCETTHGALLEQTLSGITLE